MRSAAEVACSRRVHGPACTLYNVPSWRMSNAAPSQSSWRVSCVTALRAFSSEPKAPNWSQKPRREPAGGAVADDARGDAADGDAAVGDAADGDAADGDAAVGDARVPPELAAAPEPSAGGGGAASGETIVTTGGGSAGDAAAADAAAPPNSVVSSTSTYALPAAT